MLAKEIIDILSASQKLGWILEPEAKRLLSITGLDVPRFKWTHQIDDAIQFANDIGYPVVAKIVSPDVLHKSDQAGVAVGIDSDARLKKTFKRLQTLEGFAGVLVEEMVSGFELIVGAKIDFQFGPVILLGIGGTGVEIYQDVSVRMAPLKETDIESMLKGLKGYQYLTGYRGAAPVNRKKLTRLILAFSDLTMALEGHIESIDLNPVMCSNRSCIVADARIMLKQDPSLSI
jgi:succinyl-CoA synthetase beta subunit